MPSGHSMNISTRIFGCTNAVPASNGSAAHAYSYWNKFSPIIILVDLSVITGESDYV